MAKNVRIVPTSGSIYFTADGASVGNSIRLQTVGSTNDVQFIDGETDESILLIGKDSKRVGIGTVSASAKLDVSSTENEDLLLVKNSSAGIKVNNEGILQFLEYDGIPTIVSGGMYYSSGNFFLGI